MASWSNNRGFTGQWWVVHAKSRNEKALAWDLLRKEISYFLPMTNKVRKAKGRTLRSLLPLFTGYLFVCCNENERGDVLKTNRIANLIKVDDGPKLVKELSPIAKAIEAGKCLEVYNKIERGQLCRVVAGPLIGTEGIVVNVSDKLKLVLEVDILGQATSLEINPDMIELLK